MLDCGKVESVSLSPRVRYRAVGNEGVVVHLDEARVIVVSEVGLRILKALSTPTTRDDLVDVITSEYDVDEVRAGKDIDVFLDKLNEEQLVRFDAAALGVRNDV